MPKADEIDIVTRLLAAIQTATNDDYSLVGSSNRQRHVERIDAMSEAIDEITRLRSITPDGWKLVPVEPTAEMVEVALDAAILHIQPMRPYKLAKYKRENPDASEMREFLRAAIRATLSASPSPPVEDKV